jgi:hypothetical protein
MQYKLISSVFIPLLVLLASPSTSTPIDFYSPPSKAGHHQSRYTPIHPLFTLHNITYSSSIIYSTPAHLAVAEGIVSFNLSNSAIPYTTYCSGSSSQIYDFFYGNIAYKCDSSPGMSALFTFSKLDGTFAVNQTWECLDGRHHKK